MRVTVEYQIGDRSGRVNLNVGEDAETDEIIAKAKRIVTTRDGPDWPPVRYEHWKVVDSAR